MSGAVATPEDYLASLPEDRRHALSELRQQILKVLPKGYEETMQYGMITYVVPHSLYPSGYHCNPKDALPYVSVGSQKGHMSLHLAFLYGNEKGERFREEYSATGKKLDMGAACLRFKRLDDLAIDVVLQAIGSTSVEEYVSAYEAAIPPSKRKKAKSSAHA